VQVFTKAVCNLLSSALHTEKHNWLCAPLFLEVSVHVLSFGCFLLYKKSTCCFAVAKVADCHCLWVFVNSEVIEYGCARVHVVDGSHF